MPGEDKTNNSRRRIFGSSWLLGALGMLGLVLLLLELCARFDDLITWEAPFFADYSNENLTITDELGPRCRPRGQFAKWRLNRFGFRGPDITLAKPPGVVRVALVGASETFGLYESRDMEFPAQLQRMLEAREPGRFQVINASCAGMSPPRITHNYEVWLKRFHPDAVIFYPSPQFYLDEEPPRNTFVRRDEQRPRFYPRLLRKAKTALKRFIPAEIQTLFRQLSIARAVRGHDAQWLWRQIPAERVRLFTTQLANLVEAVQDSGATIFFSTHASRFGRDLHETDQRQLIALRAFYPRATPEVILAFEAQINEIIRAWGKSKRITVIDVDRQLAKHPDLFADFAHFSDQGAQAVATILDQTIRHHFHKTRSAP